MAHFAELDANNIVTRVMVVSNADMVDENGDEQQSMGIEVCRSIFGADTTWVQTSYNGNFRDHYAGPGYFYDQQNDRFIPPKPHDYPSFVYENKQWQPPAPRPDDDLNYSWNEGTLTWELLPPEPTDDELSPTDE